MARLGGWHRVRGQHCGHWQLYTLACLNCDIDAAINTHYVYRLKKLREQWRIESRPGNFQVTFTFLFVMLYSSQHESMSEWRNSSRHTAQYIADAYLLAGVEWLPVCGGGGEEPLHVLGGAGAGGSLHLPHTQLGAGLILLQLKLKHTVINMVLQYTQSMQSIFL